MKVKVRKAVYTDLFHIERVLADVYAENAEVLPKIEVPHLYYDVIGLIDQGFAHVAVTENALVGFSAVAPVSMPWAPNQFFLSNRYWAVHRKFRASSAGEDLFNAMVGLAANMGPEGINLIISINTATRPAEKLDFLERAGGEFIGGNVLFRAPGAASAGNERGGQTH